MYTNNFDTVRWNGVGENLTDLCYVVWRKRAITKDSLLEVYFTHLKNVEINRIDSGEWETRALQVIPDKLGETVQ